MFFFKLIFFKLFNERSEEYRLFSMSAEEINWRKIILKSLTDRNKRETISFNEIITQSLY